MWAVLPTCCQCSWGGPAKRAGGNGPADGDWEPAVTELLSKASYQSVPPSANLSHGIPEQEQAPEAEAAGTAVALRTRRPIVSFVAGARWGDSACSFVVDLAGPLSPESYYALPQDIALCAGSEAASATTQLHPLKRVGSDGNSAVVWNVRPLTRARSLWLVSFLAVERGGGVVARIGSIEWQEVPVVVRAIETRDRLEDVFAIVGWR